MKRLNIKNNQYMNGQKLKLYPSNKQKELLDNFIHQYRFVYNWGVEIEEKHYIEYLNGEHEFSFIKYNDLIKLFNEYKKSLPWFILPSHTCRNALLEVDKGYDRYFKKIYKHKPRFKSKKESKNVFHPDHERFKIDQNNIIFELNRSMSRNDNEIRIVSIGFDSKFTKDMKYYNPTITRDDKGDYWVSFCTIEDKNNIELIDGEVIGVDFGITNTLTTSKPINGEYFHRRPKEKTNKLTKRIKRLDKQISRDRERRRREAQRLSDKTGTRVKASQIPKSKRELKREEQRRKDYSKISNIKKTYYHTMTKKIVTSGYTVGIEDIRVKKLHKTNPKYISNKISRESFYSERLMFEYKCERYNVPLIIVPYNYPSSQICSCCGYQQKMPLGVHIYNCPNCGNVMDRDLNAAYNLANYTSQLYRINTYGKVA